MDRISICSSNFTRRKRELFWDHLMNGDEKWVVYKHVVKKSICLLKGYTTMLIQSWRTSEEGYVVLLIRQQEPDKLCNPPKHPMKCSSDIKKLLEQLDTMDLSNVDTAMTTIQHIADVSKSINKKSKDGSKKSSSEDGKKDGEDDDIDLEAMKKGNLKNMIAIVKKLVNKTSGPFSPGVDPEDLSVLYKMQEIVSIVFSEGQADLWKELEAEGEDSVALLTSVQDWSMSKLLESKATEKNVDMLVMSENVATQSIKSPPKELAKKHAPYMYFPDYGKDPKWQELRKKWGGAADQMRIPTAILGESVLPCLVTVLERGFLEDPSGDSPFLPEPLQLNCQVIYSQFGLAIHQNDHQARRRFVEWAQNEIAVVPDFHKRILFSDEAHFWLNGYVNKQNCRIWSEANPQVYVETPLHPEKLTVWCALWAGDIIGPYFFKNDEGHNVTVNGDRYRAMITNFFILELNNRDVQELWFQQDGTTCHTARATIDLLKDMFGDRLISRFGPVNWPPRSCDLTLLDYFLWGYVKSLVYADKPQTLMTIWKTTFAVLLPIYGHKCWKKFPLTAKHGRQRLQWAHERRAWQADWHHVVFSDDSRFNLWDPDGRIRVRLCAGEGCLPECVIERHSGLTPGVMVWVAISYHERSNLLRIEGNLNSNRYVSQHMQLLPWPAHPPDISPIEHVWDLVGRRLTLDPRHAASKNELLLLIQAIWNSLPQADI
ncbi:uncharacterized protein TNCV_3289251 [Trichonephila clavipes]|nr:uncharacterized protein TNCV_3289251 [Trichonephila clavipes]